MKLYIQEGCPACEAIVIPEGIKVEKIDVTDESYTGFVPTSTPILQFNPQFNAEGDFFINQLLETIKKAQDGVYKQ